VALDRHRRDDVSVDFLGRCEFVLVGRHLVPHNVCMKVRLTIDRLKTAAAEFARVESDRSEPSMYGVTDGKAVGTYLEHRFRVYLEERFTLELGNSAKGIDLPGLNVDMKTTSIRQPQSSCPFRSAEQKIYGLGYALLVFVYDKTDDHALKTARLEIMHVIYVDAERTGDYQTTRGINAILDNGGNDDDLIAFMHDRYLPVDDVQAAKIAKSIMVKRPPIGYLTISNALQWRLQYKRVIDQAGAVEGVYRLR